MKIDKKENKSRVKRKISIFTVLLWLALIATMSVIIVQGVSKSNALEDGETKIITIRVDFSEYFENEGITSDSDKTSFMRNDYRFYMSTTKTNNITDYYDKIKTPTYKANEGDIGIYEVEITNEAKYIEYHYTDKEEENLYKYSVEHEDGSVEKIYESRNKQTYYGEEIKEEQDTYEIKLKKRTDIIKLTVKVDFSEYFEKSEMTSDSDKEGFMKKYGISTDKYNFSYIQNEGNIGIYEADVPETEKIIYYNENRELYYVTNSTNDIEIYLKDKSTYYAEKIKEGQSEYEVKLHEREDIKKLTIKVDFSEYFENEEITDEYDKISCMNNYRIIQNYDYYNNGMQTEADRNGRFIENDVDIGIYELKITSELTGYIRYHYTSQYKYDKYSVVNEVNDIFCDDRAYYSEKIKEGQTEYSVKIEKKEEKPKINLTVKVDFSEYFEKNGILSSYNKEQKMKSYSSNIRVYTSSNNEISTYSKYVDKTGDIGVYEIEASGDVDYVVYGQISKNFITSEEGNIEIVKSDIFNYYAEKIKEGQSEYEIKLHEREDIKKLTIRVDFSEYFEKEGINDSSKRSFMYNYINRILGVYSEIDSSYIGDIKLKENEGDIAVYEVEVSNDVEYIRYHQSNKIVSPLNDMYSIVSEENDIDILSIYDKDNRRNLYYYIERINEDQTEYNVKLQKREDIKNIIVRVDFSEYFENEGITDESNKEEKIIQWEYDINGYSKLDNSYISRTNFKELQGDIGVYEFSVSDDVEYIVYKKSNLYLFTNEKDNIELMDDNYYTEKIEDGKYEYEIKLKKIDNNLESNIKWEEDRKAILEYNVKGLTEFFNIYPKNCGWVAKHGEEQCIVFIEKLDENFELSKDYESDPKWLIVNEEDIINDELKNPYTYLNKSKDIPEYIYAHLFKIGKHGNIEISDDINCVYIKDKNILYYLMPYENNINKEIDLVLKDNKEISSDIFNFETKYVYCYLDVPACQWYYIHTCVSGDLIPKQIKYEREEKNQIVVNKLVNNELGKNTYYVGLFGNDTEEVTDKIYNIETVDGIGSIDIEVDKKEEYYIYEVDKNGRKILNEKIKYNKNKVFENSNVVSEYNITSSNNIVSSVISTSPNTLGKGKEENYINNAMLHNRVSEDTVTITSDYIEKVHLVKYETKKDGVLEGETKEVVKDGEKPANVPKVIANENYEFDKWVIIVNDEEIEVNPSEYVVYEDVTFIAKYRKIIQSDTSDINVGLYVGIVIISILVIAIITIIIVMNKKRVK